MKEEGLITGMKTRLRRKVVRLVFLTACDSWTIVQDRVPALHRMMEEFQRREWMQVP